MTTTNLSLDPDATTEEEFFAVLVGGVTSGYIEFRMIDQGGQIRRRFTPVANLRYMEIPPPLSPTCISPQSRARGWAGSGKTSGRRLAFGSTWTVRPPGFLLCPDLRGPDPAG